MKLFGYYNGARIFIHAPYPEDASWHKAVFNSCINLEQDDYLSVSIKFEQVMAPGWMQVSGRTMATEDGLIFFEGKSVRYVEINRAIPKSNS